MATATTAAAVVIPSLVDNVIRSTSLRDSRCRRSISESNLPSLKVNQDDDLPLSAAERRTEMLETMRVRKEALEEALEKKLNEMRSICLREGVSQNTHIWPSQP